MYTPITSNRIVVPLDGTAESNAALPLARTLAQVTGAAMTLMQVVPVDDFLVAIHARNTLERIAGELAGSGLTVQTLLRSGQPADEILDDVQTNGAWLVVMRTRARSGLQRLILGSVTEQVLKESPVPVVLIRPGEQRVTSIQKLLVPLDGSPGGAAPLGAAVALAHASGAKLHLLQVVVPLAMQMLVAASMGGMPYYDAAWDEEAQWEAQTYIDGVAGRLYEKGYAVETEVLVADNIAHAIAEVAERDAADLILMSTRALTGPGLAFLGSIADDVVRSAPCPVLLVHRLGAETTQVGEPVAAGARPR